MKRVLVLLCGFIVLQNIALRADAADAEARVVAISRQSAVILEDDFNDGILDGTKWAHIGISKKKPWTHVPGASVKEEDGALVISEDLSNAGGAVKSVPFSVESGDILKLTRRVRVFPKANFQNTSAFVNRDGKPVARYRYFYKCKGFVDGAYFDYDGKEHVILPWREWFTEIVTYNTSTGETTYSIPGRGEMVRTFDIVPLDQLWLMFDAYGWYTGHKVEIDYIKLEKLSSEVERQKTAFALMLNCTSGKKARQTERLAGWEGRREKQKQSNR